MAFLRQSTSVEIKIGEFVDSVDGNTQETALTISQADVRLAKNSGDWAQKNEATSLVHEEAGWYRCLLDATDTDTIGILIVAIHESGALPVWREFNVVPANVYDSLFAADLLQVEVTQIAANAITDASVATDMDAYHAKVWVVKESTSADHYAVVFFKNGQPVTSGITSPTVQVIKASDGTDLIANTALTEVGALGIYRKDESTNKMLAGAIYFAKVAATIDGASRVWLQQIGRDSV